MTNFIFDEMNAAEYRADRIAEAQEYRRASHTLDNRFLVSIYLTLSTVGALLENWGARMKARYECLARPEQCDMLPHPVK